MKKILILIIASLAFMSCTDNARAKVFGGITSIVIDEGRKVVTASWKESGLWILTEPMKPEDSPRTLEYVEKSNLGLMEGKIILIERR